MVGEFNPELKIKIDNIQFYLEYLLDFNDKKAKALYDYWLAEKERLINQIGREGKDETI